MDVALPATNKGGYALEEGFSAQGRVCVSFIDVGKGDCILLQVGESAALVDTGYANTSDAVLAHMRRQGVTRLEFVIITHYDRDHIGGLHAIGETFPIGEVFLPAYVGADKHYRNLMAAIEQLGLPMQRVTEELPLQLGSSRMSVFPSRVEYDSQAKGDEGNDNDLSLVTSLVYGGDSYLFAADLEKDGLACYLGVEDFEGEGCGARGRYDVLKVPCHGRKCSLTDEFFEDVRPQIAVITDSVEDPADKKVLKQLEDVGAAVYRTGASGTIVIVSDGAGAYSVSHA